MTCRDYKTLPGKSYQNMSEFVCDVIIKLYHSKSPGKSYQNMSHLNLGIKLFGILNKFKLMTCSMSSSSIYSQASVVISYIRTVGLKHQFGHY